MLGLPAHIHAAGFGDRVVILDTRADRYRLLTGRKARLVTMLASDAPVTDDEAARALIADRILVSDGVPIQYRTHRVATRGALEEPALQTVKFRWSELMTTAATVAVRLRATPLERVLVWSHKGIERGCKAADPILVDYAHAFERDRMYVPLRRNCLRDAILFTRLLRTREIACKLVLGVRLDPFGAHSWVQTGDLILTGKLASARELTPILIL